MKWLGAECPLLGIATQGKTEKEVKENMRDLIKEYLSDPFFNLYSSAILEKAFYMGKLRPLPQKRIIEF